MKPLLKPTIAMLGALILSACDHPQKDTLTIGIIEPLEHTAMNEIVAGFTDTLRANYHQPVTIKVENAQADVNLQRAIIQKMRDANYKVIVPIGVGATQMTLAMTKHQAVVSLASDLSDADRKKMQPCHVAIVHDEIDAKQILGFIHTVYPTLTQLTLIHSSADKVFPEVKQTVAAGKKLGITISPIMVSTLPELYSVSQAISSTTQGIFVLKDSLIVSGISTLAKTAATRHIPLITSDQGSVQDGASFALGVHERQIGIEGALLTAAVLNNKAICSLPVTDMQKLTVFINERALTQDQQLLAPITVAAKKLHYQIEKSG